MNLILEQLRNDHRQLVRVLYHLDHELKVLAGLDCGKASIERILDILDYIQTYPEIWHHPTEDVIYEILFGKPIPDPRQLANCIEEHGVLELLTENLHSYLDQLAAGRVEVRSRLIRAGSDYVNRQLTHMEHEQNMLFPLMEEYLEPQDWEAIRDRIRARQPAGDESRLHHYQCLFQSIAGSAAITAH